MQYIVRARFLLFNRSESATMLPARHARLLVFGICMLQAACAFDLGFKGGIIILGQYPSASTVVKARFVLYKAKVRPGKRHKILN